MHTMTKKQGEFGTIDVKAVMAEDEEFLRALVRTALQEVLETEMTEAVGAEKGERTAGRQGYRSGYYGRTLISRIRIPGRGKSGTIRIAPSTRLARISQASISPKAVLRMRPPRRGLEQLDLLRRGSSDSVGPF
jgi:hypothetical protein